MSLEGLNGVALAALLALHARHTRLPSPAIGEALFAFYCRRRRASFPIAWLALDRGFVPHLKSRAWRSSITSTSG